MLKGFLCESYDNISITNKIFHPNQQWPLMRTIMQCRHHRPCPPTPSEWRRGGGGIVPNAARSPKWANNCCYGVHIHTTAACRRASRYACKHNIVPVDG